MEKLAKKRSYSEAQAQSPVNFETYYELVEENVKADLIDGMVVRDSPAVPRHGHIISWLTTLLYSYVENNDLGVVLGATTTVRLSNYQALEPDVFFIAKSRKDIIGAKYIDGAPDLCIEVVSRTSRSLDRGRKFELYAEFGVREYWIIDPIIKTVEFYHNRNGEFAKIAPDAKGLIHSHALPGFWLIPNWVLTENFPRVSTILSKIQANQETN